MIILWFEMILFEIQYEIRENAIYICQTNCTLAKYFRAVIRVDAYKYTIFQHSAFFIKIKQTHK